MFSAEPEEWLRGTGNVLEILRPVVLQSQGNPLYSLVNVFCFRLLTISDLRFPIYYRFPDCANQITQLMATRGSVLLQVNNLFIFKGHLTLGRTDQ